MPAKDAAHEITAAWDLEPPALDTDPRAAAAAQTQGGLSARVPAPSIGVVDLVKIALHIQPPKPRPQQDEATNLVARLLGEDREERIAWQEKVRSRAPVIPGHIDVTTRPPVDRRIGFGQAGLGKAPAQKPTQRERIQQPIARICPCIPTENMPSRPQNLQDRRAHFRFV